MEENKIPKAYEFGADMFGLDYTPEYYHSDDVEKMLIEFAKRHVKEIAKQYGIITLKKHGIGDINNPNSIEIDTTESILAYLTNIK